MTYQTIQIKRSNTAPSDMRGLLDGELGYVKNTNELFIGTGRGNNPVLINTYSATEKIKLAGIASGAEVNQNAFSNIKVGSTTISADTKTDSLTLVGSNVTLTPDATNDKVTIGITKENVVSALGYTPPTTNTTYESMSSTEGITGTATTSRVLTAANLKAIIAGSAAAKLTTARTISLTGSVTGSGSFDGSGDLSIITTTNHNHDTLYTKKQSWQTTAGGSYVGWIKLIEWTPSTASYFSLRPILFSLYRSYNSPDPECYLLSLSVSWDSKASINLLQGNGTRIIKNFRFTRNADKTKYWFEMYVDETYSTYTNTCSCSIFGYESFTGTLLSNTLQTETVTSLKSIETVNNGIVADNFIGNASTATKLKNARTIQTNLASTSTASFDGSANVTPGVTGVLGTANGGTGVNSHGANRLVWSANSTQIQAACHYANSTKVAINSSSEPSTNFYVNGTSAFRGNITIQTDDTDRFINFVNGDGFSWRIGYLGTGTGDANYLAVQSDGPSAGTYSNALRFGLTSLDAAFGGNVYPLTNNTKTLGTSSLKWSNVYATTFTGTLAGNASTATKVNNSLIIKLNGGTTEGTNLFTFNGSVAKSINITPAAIGAAASGHNHTLTPTTATIKQVNSVGTMFAANVEGEVLILTPGSAPTTANVTVYTGLTIAAAT